MTEPISNADVLRGREAYAARRWREAFDTLSRADAEEPLAPSDLELLAVAANMMGRDDDWAGALERAHDGYLDADERQRAARCAMWIGMYFTARGAMGAAGGWIGRFQRLLEELPDAQAERGYLLLPEMFRHEAAGDLEAAAAVAGDAAAIGRRFDDPDLFALAAHGQGHMLVRAGQVREGLTLLDEAMVTATTPTVSPIVTGLVYCGVILACREVYEVGRAREWTAVLSRWCEQQPDMLAFTGRCLVHRAEILQLGGSWTDALEEARRARRRFVETHNPAAGVAHYREAELLRLRGELAAAEQAYRSASSAGWEPQPGLAQLRVAQGRLDDAVASIRRARTEVTEPLRRAAILPAYAEIMLAVGELDEAQDASRELEEINQRYESRMLVAMTAYARGAVAVAAGDPTAALSDLREALRVWQELDAPYEVGRTRALLGAACSALGDGDAASLELEAARACFEALGAIPDLARLSEMRGDARPPQDGHGLSPREVEVLRLVAAGHSNRDIAAALVISEHTVARHLQNIFRKLDVASRTAATAFAFEHGLV